jgi:hypothetical protein
MSITHVERELLGIIRKSGGRHTFRPAGVDKTAYQVFERDVVRLLQSLEAKRLVVVDQSASRRITLPGREGQYARLTAELTELGSGLVGTGSEIRRASDDADSGDHREVPRTSRGTLTARLAVMRDLVRELEERVVTGEHVPEGVEKFKAAIDDIRLRLWAVLVGAHGTEDRKGAMRRFRLQRSIDLCRAVSKEVASGDLDVHQAELTQLRLVADQLASSVEQRLKGL